MGYLGLRCPLDVQLQVRRLLLGECLQRGEGDGTLRQTIIHECNVVVQDSAIVVPPLRWHWCLVKAIQRGLHPRAIGKHWAAP